MDDVHYKIKSIIHAKTCPIHNLHAAIKIDNGIIDINCCCEAFKKACIAEIEILLKDSINVKKVGVSKKISNK
jgi:hypothetical protein